MKQVQQVFGSFVAVGERTGQRYVVNIHRSINLVDGWKGSDAVGGAIGGGKLQTDTGILVNRLDKGKYKLATYPEETLTSDDPNAP